MAADENGDGCTTNPRRTKLMLTQEMDDVTEAMKGARMLGVGIQVRNVARPGDRPGHCLDSSCSTTCRSAPTRGRTRRSGPASGPHVGAAAPPVDHLGVDDVGHVGIKAGATQELH